MNLNDIYAYFSMAFIIAFGIFAMYCGIASVNNYQRSMNLFFKGVFITFILLFFMGGIAFYLSEQNIQSTAEHNRFEEKKNGQNDNKPKKTKILKSRYEMR